MRDWSGMVVVLVVLLYCLLFVECLFDLCE